MRIKTMRFYVQIKVMKKEKLKTNFSGNLSS